MQRVKTIRNKRNYNRKYNIYKKAAIAAILIGGAVFISYLYHFSQGITAGRALTASEITDNSSRSQVSDKKADQDAQSASVSGKQQKKHSLYLLRPEEGDKVGELYIPKLKAAIPIYQGTKEEELAKGAGHFLDSVLPGESDNCVISGHRDTVFRKLGSVGKGDLLIAKTSAGKFTYMIKKVRIVDADDRTVIVPKPSATLTLSTCYPFRYIGPAPKRYILVACLIKENID